MTQLALRRTAQLGWNRGFRAARSFGAVKQFSRCPEEGKQQYSRWLPNLVCLTCFLCRRSCQGHQTLGLQSGARCILLAATCQLSSSSRDPAPHCESVAWLQLPPRWDSAGTVAPIYQGGGAAVHAGSSGNHRGGGGNRGRL